MDRSIKRHALVNNFLEFSTLKLPQKTALICNNNRVTYNEINVMSNMLASSLRDMGVNRGDRVAVFMSNSLEAVVSIFAVLKAGAVFMVINPTTKSEKLEYILNDSGAKVLITQRSLIDVVEKTNCPTLLAIIAKETECEHSGIIPYSSFMKSGKAGDHDSGCLDIDLASIIYTSGSTGNPKGVMLSHLNIITAAHSITSYLENREDDIILNLLPISFDYGLYQIFMGFMIGATVVLENSFFMPYQIVDIIVKEKITGFPGVPTIFSILLQLKNLKNYDFSSLRYITNTAAALPVSHINKLREIFPQARLYSMYGLTECKRVSYLPPEDIDKKPTSVGRGMPNQELFIVNEKGEKAAPGEVGELVIRGSHVMLGYWNMPEETAKCIRPGRYPGERLLYSGDLFKMDEDGYLYFVARKDDIIKSRGEKVSPREIENVLYNIPGILEAAVIGVKDEVLGEAIKAFVVLEEDAKITEKDILKYCSARLENFMIPKYIELCSSLPKTDSGKIKKSTLKEKLMVS